MNFNGDLTTFFNTMISEELNSLQDNDGTEAAYDHISDFFSVVGGERKAIRAWVDEYFEDNGVQADNFRTAIMNSIDIDCIYDSFKELMDDLKEQLDAELADLEKED